MGIKISELQEQTILNDEDMFPISNNENGTRKVNFSTLKKDYETKIDEATKTSHIVAYLESKQEISKGVFTVGLDTSTAKGDYFELDSTNHRIKVLKDCSALISAALFIDDGAGNGYIWGRIKVNNVNEASSIIPINGTLFYGVQIAERPVELKANDVLSLEIEYMSESGNPKLRASQSTTYLCIAKL